MSYSLSDLKFLNPSTLRGWFGNGASQNGNGKFAIVDVRDSDYLGGHIKGCLHHPYQSFNYTVTELREKIKGCDDVVFHCALSQQRGPSATLKFLRSLNDLSDKEKQEFENLNIWVLRGGFTKWQEEYGEDASVTEDYNKDLWRFGY